MVEDFVSCLVYLCLSQVYKDILLCFRLKMLLFYLSHLATGLCGLDFCVVSEVGGQGLFCSGDRAS